MLEEFLIVVQLFILLRPGGRCRRPFVESTGVSIGELYMIPKDWSGLDGRVRAKRLRWMQEVDRF